MIRNYEALKEEVMDELEDCVCTKHPPDWDIETKAINIIAAVEARLS